jgi:hypothetical protein
MANAPSEMIQRRIVATDRQIDELVYELYGLTEEEIGVVERSIQALFILLNFPK